MPTHAWRCPECREPLGTVTSWTYQRKPCSRLTLNRRAISVDYRPKCPKVRCVCGGTKSFCGGEIRRAIKT